MTPNTNTPPPNNDDLYRSEEFRVLLHAAAVNTFYHRLLSAFQDIAPQALIRDMLHFSGYLISIYQLQIANKEEFNIRELDEQFFDDSISTSMRLANEMLHQVRRSLEQHPEMATQLILAVPPFPQAVTQYLTEQAAKNNNKVVDIDTPPVLN